MLLGFVAEKVDGLALLHMKTLRDDSKIFSRLWIWSGDAVRLLTIIRQFANQRVKEKPSLTAQKDFTPRTKSVYQTKYIWLLFFFYIINNPVCKESLLSWFSCSRISDLIVLPARKEINSELKQWSYYTHRNSDPTETVILLHSPKRYYLSFASLPVYLS